MAVWSCRVKLVQVREDENVAIPKISILSFISNFFITTRDYKIASLVYASMPFLMHLDIQHVCISHSTNLELAHSFEKMAAIELDKQKQT